LLRLADRKRQQQRADRSCWQERRRADDKPTAGNAYEGSVTAPRLTRARKLLTY
jgi:hypothetical protein